MNKNIVMLVNCVNAAVSAIDNLSVVLDLGTSFFRIGGSLALDLQIEEFYRRPHDLDIIINISDECKVLHLQKKLNAMSKLYGGISYSECEGKYSYTVAVLPCGDRKIPLNIIIDTAQYQRTEAKPTTIRIGDNYYRLQHPTAIKWAKQSYKPARIKDIQDIKIIEKWEESQRSFNLPF